MNFHFTIIKRTNQHKIMLSYLETVHSLMWGLEQLGHDCTFGFNSIARGRKNVISNSSLLTFEEISSLPIKTIFLNLEQRLFDIGPNYRLILDNNQDKSINDGWKKFLHVLDNHTYWDYSYRNIRFINSLQPESSHFYIPICWTPTLEKNLINRPKNIDLIFYGVYTKSRHEFCTQTITAPQLESPSFLSFSNIFGDKRDELLGSCKVCLVAPAISERPEIFGIVRAGFLMANRIPLVSQSLKEIGDDYIESDILETVKFVSDEDAGMVLEGLLTSENERLGYTEELYNCIRRRNILEYLEVALEDC